MPNGEHAKLAPSAAKQWILCSGSPRLSASVVDEGSIFAAEGTAGHEVFAICGDTKITPASFIGKKAGNGVEISEELAEHVKTALEWVDEFRALNPEAAIFKEHRVEIGEGLGLAAGILWGTCDFAAMTVSELIVADLKLGYVDVFVEDNEQLILYALGLMDLTGWIYDSVRVVILQPKKSLAPREIHYTAAEMMEFAKRFAAAARAALEPDAPLTPSKDACKYCRAAGVCPELKKEMLALCKREFSSLYTLSGEEVGQILDQAKMIEGAIRRVRAHAIKLLEIDPNHIPGWKRVQGEKRRRFKNPETAQGQLEGLIIGPEQEKLSLDDIAPRKLTTPLQIETQIAAIIHTAEKRAGRKMTKKHAAELASLWTRDLIEKPEGEPTLVPEDDKREALAPVFTEAEVAELEAAEAAAKVGKAIELID